MSYLILARKWRPQVLEDVVGQEHIVQTLKNSVKEGKLAQAYLFVGPRGVGKTSCARILAKSLNCKDAPTVTPCGQCSSCREISEGRSLDVIEIDGASNRGIDEIRTLRENVKFSPLCGKYKIYIIDEVHMLTQEAFNALLKTLEEPPEHVKFIFATTHVSKVLPTILSRCQRFEFNHIPVLKIIAKLEEICREEKINIGKDVLLNIAQISDGSLRDAESTLDQLVSYAQSDIKIKDVLEVMGLIEQEMFFKFVEALKDKDAALCINFLSQLFNSGKNISKFLEGLLWHLRGLMLALVMKGDLAQVLDLPAEVIEKIVQQAKDISLQEIVNIFSAVMNAQDMAKKIGSFRLPLELMVVKLTALLKTESFSGAAIPVVKKENNEKVDFKQAVQASGKNDFYRHIKLDNAGVLFREPDVKSEKGVDFESVQKSWPQVIEIISRVKISLGSYLKDSRPIKIEDGRMLVIGFPKKAIFYKEAVEEKQNQNIVLDKINELFPALEALRMEITEEQNLSEEDQETDNLLKSTLDLFKGKVVSK